ncbi:toll/interleukin-1 receptor domain-containing protein [Arthrobacter sp. H14-L1]|uniref:toll/interleukin-1 receptor domain-containing protein n=1 Tax=Arthrobacter sp. H14-L1 TaxID=2996697 RepID=UPI002271E292|nr:TIR domain-containing protein [Arthrobacter sp. H14-L1]MCY0905128.1 TIR domain-containing protein [Arthrobacter sp. H14-L1]
MATPADTATRRQLSVFVSYARADKDSVAAFVDDIQALCDVWVDRKLDGGQSWWDEILRQIQGCDAMVLAVSPALVNSEAAERERRYAVQLGKPILPVLLVPMDREFAPGDIAKLQIIDYTTANRQAAFQFAGALHRLPATPALPDPLPEPPLVPISYMVTLAEKVHMAKTLDEQNSVISELRTALDRPAQRDMTLRLLGQFEEHPDIFYSVGRQIEELLGRENTRDSNGWESTGQQRRAPHEPSEPAVQQPFVQQGPTQQQPLVQQPAPQQRPLQQQAFVQQGPTQQQPMYQAQQALTQNPQAGPRTKVSIPWTVAIIATVLEVLVLGGLGTIAVILCARAAANRTAGQLEQSAQKALVAKVLAWIGIAFSILFWIAVIGSRPSSGSPGY